MSQNILFFIGVVLGVLAALSFVAMPYFAWRSKVASDSAATVTAAVPDASVEREIRAKLKKVSKYAEWACSVLALLAVIALGVSQRVHWQPDRELMFYAGLLLAAVCFAFGAYVSRQLKIVIPHRLNSELTSDAERVRLTKLQATMWNPKLVKDLYIGGFLILFLVILQLIG